MLGEVRNALKNVKPCETLKILFPNKPISKTNSSKHQQHSKKRCQLHITLLQISFHPPQRHHHPQRPIGRRSGAPPRNARAAGHGPRAVAGGEALAEAMAAVPRQLSQGRSVKSWIAAIIFLLGLNLGNLRPS